MHIDQHPVGSIAWVDLVATDLAAQVDFYRSMMSWGLAGDGDDGAEYVTFTTDGVPVAGALAVAGDVGDMPSLWSVYVHVDDADRACDRAVELEGTVFREPFEIPAGRIAVIGDPTGATLCLFEGAGPNGFGLYDEPGAPCWFESISRDAVTAVRFYEELFGWTATSMPGASQPYYTLALPGADRALGGVLQIGDDTPAEVPSFWQVSFSIHVDVDTFMAQATERGGAVLLGPLHTPFGSGAVMADPQGAFFVAFDRSMAQAAESE